MDIEALAARLLGSKAAVFQRICIFWLDGIQAVNLAVPILAEELEAVTAHQTQMKKPTTPP